MPSRRSSSSGVSTSWQPVSEWYDAAVGTTGHYYHQHVVLPKSLQLLQLTAESSLLDLGCGQGILAREIPEGVYYQGLDLAPNLVRAAKQHDQQQTHHFAVANVAHPLPIQKHDFSHVSCILAIQNMDNPAAVCQQAMRHLAPGGSFLLVLNHPCFRVPRQSSWGVDETKKTQYRRIDRYLSPLKVPITAHPGQKSSAVTWSFHFPLSTYTAALSQSGFFIRTIEEWVSDKTSAGKAAKMENRSRSEFPLFLAILAVKL